MSCLVSPLEAGTEKRKPLPGKVDFDFSVDEERGDTIRTEAIRSNGPMQIRLGRGRSYFTTFRPSEQALLIQASLP
jgi:hypothetical protein